MRLLERLRAAAGRAIGRLALVGADPRDDEDLRARKALLVLISVLILPVAALWGALYLALGSWVGVRRPGLDQVRPRAAMEVRIEVLRRELREERHEDRMGDATRERIPLQPLAGPLKSP